MTTPTTAGDMLALLRRHYIPDEKVPAGIFAAEITAPGRSGRRADLIFQGCVSATGSALVGHEVKVSRSDVLAELADLTKSDPWQRYCDRWYLVVPSLQLLEGLDLPDTWGVMTPPSGRRTRSMTIEVKAPKLTPVDQAPALRVLATWVHWRHRDAAHARDQARTERERWEQRARDAEARAPRADGTSRLHGLVEQIVTGLGGPARYGDAGIGGGTGGEPLSVDDVVAALTDLQQTREAARRVRWRLQDTARGLARALEGIKHADVRALLAESEEADRLRA